MPSSLDDIKIYCFNGFVKHASLVNAVYPTKAGEEGPRSSQLSYLLYYAQHRTEKLAKVGKYLHKKFTWDATKDKKAFHRVTLEILNSLIDTCHTNLSYFAKPLIQILNDMFEIGDTSLLPEMTVTFIKFNTYYDASLDMDDTFAPAFQQLIDRYCQLAMVTNEKEDSQLHLRTVQETTLTGLEAIKSIALSSYIFKSSQSEKYTSKIVPPLLYNVIASFSTSTKSHPLIHSSSSSASSSNKRDSELMDSAPLPTNRRSLSPKRPSIFDDVVNEDELTNIALSSIQRLVRNAHAASIAHVAIPIFDFLDRFNKWEDVFWSQLLLRKLNNVSNTPTQTAFLGQLILRLNLPHFAYKSNILTMLPKLQFDTPCLAVSLTDIMDSFLLIAPLYSNEVQQCLEWLTLVFVTTPKEFLTLVMAKLSAFSELIETILKLLVHHACSYSESTITRIPSSSFLEPYWQLDTFVPVFPLLISSSDSPDSKLPSLVRRLLLKLPSSGLPTLTELIPYITTELDLPLLMYHATKPSDQLVCLRTLQSSRSPMFMRTYLTALGQWAPSLAPFCSEEEGSIDLSALEAALLENEDSLALSKPLSSSSSSSSSSPFAAMPSTPSTNLVNASNSNPSNSTSSSSSSNATTSPSSPSSNSIPPGLSQPQSSTQKPKSVFNFPSIERNDVTTEELQAILAGKKVAQRPVSLLVTEWTAQGTEYNFEKVLDEV